MDENKGNRMENTGIRPTIAREKSVIRLLIAASLYFLTVDVLGDEVTLRLMGEKAELLIHIGYLFAQGLGFLFFSYIHRMETVHSSHLPMLLVYCVSGFSLMAFLLVNVNLVVVFGILLCLFTSGIIGGSVYFDFSVRLGESSYLGRICGCAIAIAALLQILVMMLPLSVEVKGMVLCVFLLFAALLEFKGRILELDRETTVAHNQMMNLEDRKRRRIFIVLLLSVAVISVMGGINDGTLTLMNARETLQLYSFPRVFYLVGVLIAGFLADYQNSKYLPITVLCIMILATVGILFLDSTALLNMNACIYSLFAGFAIIWFTVPFMRIARSSSNQSLVAGLGRAIRLVFMAIGTILMSYCLEAAPFQLTIGVFVLLAVILVVLFYGGGLLNMKLYEGITPNKEELTEFCALYQLTKREHEILQLIYEGKSTSEVAIQLFISEKTVRNHISNMLVKTKSSSRTELLVKIRKS